ncbi:AAA family ATPase [candidate division KSB1 bacterium]|nr:AAA family ATPase [candidate division KSB1 bacterium]
MGNNIKIVVVNLSETEESTVRKIIKDIPNAEIVAQTSQFLDGYDIIKNENPDIVIINLYQAEEKALNLAERISTNLPNVTLFLSSPQAYPEIIIRSMRAGAREFIIQPFKKEELITAINNYLEFKERSSIGKGRDGKIISIFGVKGGVGATTVATNLAVLLRKKSNKDVVLVDFNFKLGNAALYLNIKPKFSIMDVALNLTNIDGERLKKSLPKHSSGVCMLPGPSRLEDSESLKGIQVEKILNILKNLFDFIIIDSSREFDDLNIKALDSSDLILAIANIEIATIYNAKSCLDLFKRMGYDKDKVRLVLNRFATQNGFTSETLEKTIDYPIFLKIPNQTYANVIDSINQGTPITQMMPKSKMSVSFDDLISKLNGKLSIQKEDKKSKSLLKKLIKK